MLAGVPLKKKKDADWIGGKTITSTESEKLLGLHINSNFD